MHERNETQRLLMMWYKHGQGSKRERETQERAKIKCWES